ncbi:hypothetical protein SLE2022_372000 [Rubroshorea leprosula]
MRLVFAVSLDPISYIMKDEMVKSRRIGCTMVTIFFPAFAFSRIDIHLLEIFLAQKLPGKSYTFRWAVVPYFSYPSLVLFSKLTLLVFIVELVHSTRLVYNYQSSTSIIDN